MGKIPPWEQTSRKLPSWTKSQLITTAYKRFLENTLLTIKVRTHRAYQDVKSHASGLDWPSTLTSTVLLFVYFTFFAFYVYSFAAFMQGLRWFASNGVDSSSWSFGQIVAITVWAGPLCEYFHLEIRKSPPFVPSFSFQGKKGTLVQ